GLLESLAAPGRSVAVQDFHPGRPGLSSCPPGCAVLFLTLPVRCDVAYVACFTAKDERSWGCIGRVRGRAGTNDARWVAIRRTPEVSSQERCRRSFQFASMPTSPRWFSELWYARGTAPKRVLNSSTPLRPALPRKSSAAYPSRTASPIMWR